MGSNINTNSDYSDKRKPLVVSVSGGETSMYMAARLRWEYSHIFKVDCVFSNTGLEHPRTYEFLKEADEFFNLNLTYIEYYRTGIKGVGARYNIVKQENLHKGNAIFIDMVNHYKTGFPSARLGYCSLELKRDIIHRYAVDKYGKSFNVAIGIRSDEFDRMSVNASRYKVIYPLIQKGYFPSTKNDVERYWGNQPFRLNLMPELKNCIGCIHKSVNTLKINAKYAPNEFEYMHDAWRKVGKGYGIYGAGLTPDQVLSMPDQTELFIDDFECDGMSNCGV